MCIWCARTCWRLCWFEEHLEDLTTLEDLDDGALCLCWLLGWFDDSWRITLWRILLYLEDIAILGDFVILWSLDYDALVLG